MPGEPPTILIIEDEEKIVDVLRAYLERDGYSVLTAADGETGLETALRERPSLVILDLMLPKLGGEEVCARLRQVSSLPILILSARGTTQDRIFGLSIGADDYLPKPFSPAEVVARVKALLRRAGQGEGGSKPVLSYERGRLVIDGLSRVVKLDGRPIGLTPTEYALLQILASHPGQALSRARLVELVQGYDFIGSDRTIDAHIKNLRKKIGDGEDQRLVQTVFGYGYRFGGDPDAL